jgi:uncharacterized MAPEG superfamily protein
MHAFDFGTVELRMLWAAAVLGLVQMVLSVVLSGTPGRLQWALGARDSDGPARGTFGNRLDRAWRNFLETFPIFAAFVLIAQALDLHTSHTALGAQLYFWGRVAYLPLYAFGVAYVRTLAWAVALVGIILLGLAIWPG